jgi:Flp pilus assembly protein CpaB
MEKRRSPWIAIILAVVIGLMVIVLLNGYIRPTSVVVAKVALAPGTRLTSELLELRTIPMQARPRDAFERIKDVQDKVLAVGRAPGDYIVASALGDTAQAGIPTDLKADHLAVAVKVDLATGIAGLLREGQTVTLIGMLSPDVLQSVAAAPIPVNSPFPGEPTAVALVPGQPTPTPTPTPTPAPPVAPLARIAISGLKVLMVPQSFRYEELPSSSTQEQLFASARTVSAAQEGNVVVLDVPATPVEIVPGMKVNPTTLIVALSEYGSLYLTLEPAKGFQAPDILTLNLADLYDAMNDDRGGK